MSLYSFRLCAIIILCVKFLIGSSQSIPDTLVFNEALCNVCSAYLKNYLDHKGKQNFKEEVSFGDRTYQVQSSVGGVLDLSYRKENLTYLMPPFGDLDFFYGENATSKQYKLIVNDTYFNEGPFLKRKDWKRAEYLLKHANCVKILDEKNDIVFMLYKTANGIELTKQADSHLENLVILAALLTLQLGE